VERLLLAAASLPLRTTKPDRDPDSTESPQLLTRLGADDLEVVRDGKSIRMVKPSQIRAIQAEGSYTRLLFDSDVSSMVKLPLSYWERRLPEGLFFKVSRSMLVNLTSIRQLQGSSRERTHLFLSGVSQPLVLSRLESLRVRREL
jgi:two-component system LytT family response regulator